jgi:peptidoglycan-associated lipoprotein
MMYANRFLVAICMFLLFGTFLEGCSQTTKSATKTDAATSGGQAAKESQTQVQTANPPRSSLEAVQRGESPEGGPLKDIYFDFDRAELNAGARETLNANAAWLKANASNHVQIEGHADERGTNEYNLALGAKRAQSAKDYLTSLGITPDRLSTISYGEELSVCKEQTEACWQRNRRDRFVVQSGKPAS